MAKSTTGKHPAPETEIDLINQALAAKSMSMNALADETSIPYATLRRSLKGARPVTLPELRAIAAALNLQPSALLPAEFTKAAA